MCRQVCSSRSLANFRKVSEGQDVRFSHYHIGKQKRERPWQVEGHASATLETLFLGSRGVHSVDTNHHPRTTKRDTNEHRSCNRAACW